MVIIIARVNFRESFDNPYLKRFKLKKKQKNIDIDICCATYRLMAL